MHCSKCLPSSAVFHPFHHSLTMHTTDWRLSYCRAFRNWKAFRTLSLVKKAKLQRAAMLCFGKVTLRAWRAWAAHVAWQHSKAKAADQCKVGVPRHKESYRQRNGRE